MSEYGELKLNRDCLFVRFAVRRCDCEVFCGFHSVSFVRSGILAHRLDHACEYTHKNASDNR